MRATAATAGLAITLGLLGVARSQRLAAVAEHERLRFQYENLKAWVDLVCECDEQLEMEGDAFGEYPTGGGGFTSLAPCVQHLDGLYGQGDEILGSQRATRPKRLEGSLCRVIGIDRAERSTETLREGRR